MRTRLIRPEFVTDEVLGSLPDPLVLFYVKLWLLTDDEGYFDYRPRQIAATLYPYRADAIRTRQVVAWLARLVELRRVALPSCGLHGVVPTVSKHGMMGGSRRYTIRDKHQATCLVRTSPD